MDHDYGNELQSIHKQPRSDPLRRGCLISVWGLFWGFALLVVLCCLSFVVYEYQTDRFFEELSGIGDSLGGIGGWPMGYDAHMTIPGHQVRSNEEIDRLILVLQNRPFWISISIWYDPAALTDAQVARIGPVVDGLYEERAARDDRP